MSENARRGRTRKKKRRDNNDESRSNRSAADATAAAASSGSRVATTTAHSLSPILPPLPVIQVPGPLDVILGREKLNAWQRGNVKLVQNIEDRMTQYRRIKGRRKKTRVIQEIYDNATIRNGGRFLARHPTAPSGYMVVDEGTAKERIGYMIRYRRRKGTGKEQGHDKEGKDIEHDDNIILQKDDDEGDDQNDDNDDDRKPAAIQPQATSNWFGQSRSSHLSSDTAAATTTTTTTTTSPGVNLPPLRMQRLMNHPGLANAFMNIPNASPVAAAVASSAERTGRAENPVSMTGGRGTYVPSNYADTLAYLSSGNVQHEAQQQQQQQQTQRHPHQQQRLRREPPQQQQATFASLREYFLSNMNTGNALAGLTLPSSAVHDNYPNTSVSLAQQPLPQQQQQQQQQHERPAYQRHAIQVQPMQSPHRQQQPQQQHQQQQQQQQQPPSHEEKDGLPEISLEGLNYTTTFLQPLQQQQALTSSSPTSPRRRRSSLPEEGLFADDDLDSVLGPQHQPQQPPPNNN